MFDELLDAGTYDMYFEGPARVVGGDPRRDKKYRSFMVQNAEFSVPRELKLNVPFKFCVSLANHVPKETLNSLVLLKFHRVGNAGDVGSTGMRQRACEDKYLPYFFSTLEALENDESLKSILGQSLAKYEGDSFFIAAYAFVKGEKPLKKEDFDICDPGVVGDAILLGKSDPFTLTKATEYEAKTVNINVPIEDNVPATAVQQILSPTSETVYAPGDTVFIKLAKPISSPDAQFLRERFPQLEPIERYVDQIVQVLMFDVRDRKTVRQFTGQFPSQNRDLLRFTIPHNQNPGNYVIHVSNGKTEESVESFCAILTVCNGIVVAPTPSKTWELQEPELIKFDTRIAAKNFTAFKIRLFVDMAAFIGAVSCRNNLPGSLEASNELSINFADIPKKDIEGNTVSLKVLVDGIPDQLLGRRHFFFTVTGVHTDGYEVPISLSDNFGIYCDQDPEYCRSVINLQAEVFIEARLFDDPTQTTGGKMSRPLDLCSNMIPISTAVRSLLPGTLHFVSPKMK
ncbi:hypothetical protein PSACC_01473 [Paramicrosporidium saccamoebae]|uniref:Uncharacterized protein n=1 Tax=Paramicrosporidium saccamoebae TaxID=1246581 RepID=A0A2H9TLV6_9FUNG|nr:hypothetical protein PSACC_01473 [Paramicrosporidium saccamoebae]